MNIQNTNFLQPSGFTISFSRSPEITFFANSVSIPDLSISNPRRSTPFSTIPEPGDHVEFGQFQIQFLMDEDMKTYQCIYDWMMQIGFPETHTQFIDGIAATNGDAVGKIENLLSDITITVLNNHKRPIAKFTFKDCMPSSLSGAELNLTSGVEPIIASATFDYTLFTMSRAI